MLPPAGINSNAFWTVNKVPRAFRPKVVSKSCSVIWPSGAASPNLRHTTVEAFLEHWHDRPDLVVLDPPRTGVAARALSRLIKIGPQEIVYLSCDPATLARDLAILAGDTQNPGTYRIGEVHLVDIFPQTYHIEALVRLSRRA